MPEQCLWSLQQAFGITETTVAAWSSATLFKLLTDRVESVGLSSQQREAPKMTHWLMCNESISEKVAVCKQKPAQSGNMFLWERCLVFSGVITISILLFLFVIIYSASRVWRDDTMEKMQSKPVLYICIYTLAVADLNFFFEFHLKCISCVCLCLLYFSIYS